MITGRIEAKVAFWAAIVAGVTYLFGMNADIHPTLLMGWKGAGVWLLAIYAAINAEENDGWLIAFVMAMGALGDVLVERDLTQGSLAFIAGHVVATLLYLKHRRKESLTPSQKWLAIVAVPAVLVISWGLTHDPMVVLYSLFLSVMAASAWISRFPRLRTGVGAMMFVASDLLIFAQMGPLANADWPSPLIWVLYFAGQALIVIGVVHVLKQKHRSPAR